MFVIFLNILINYILQFLTYYFLHDILIRFWNIVIYIELLKYLFLMEKYMQSNVKHAL